MTFRTERVRSAPQLAPRPPPYRVRFLDKISGRHTKSKIQIIFGGSTVQRYTGRWERTDLGDATLRDIDIEEGSSYAVSNSGQVFEYTGTCEEETTETGRSLDGLALGFLDVAVGAGGTVITRERPDGSI